MPILIDEMCYDRFVFNPSSPPHISLANILSKSPIFQQIDKTVQSQIIAYTAFGYVKVDAHFANIENNTKGFTVFCASPRIATAIKTMLRADTKTKRWTITQIRSRFGHVNELRKICHDALSPLQAESCSKNIPVKHFRLKPVTSLIEGHIVMAAKIAIYMHDGSAFTLSPNDPDKENSLKFSLSNLHNNPTPLLSKESILSALTKKLSLPPPSPPIESTAVMQTPPVSTPPAPEYPPHNSDETPIRQPGMLLPNMSTPPPPLPRCRPPHSSTEPAVEEAARDPSCRKVSVTISAQSKNKNLCDNGESETKKMSQLKNSTVTPKNKRRSKRKNISPSVENFSVFNISASKIKKQKKFESSLQTQTHTHTHTHTNTNTNINPQFV